MISNNNLKIFGKFFRCFKDMVHKNWLYKVIFISLIGLQILSAAHLQKHKFALERGDNLIIERVNDLLSEYFNAYISGPDGKKDWILQPENNAGIKIKDYLVQEDSFIFGGYTYSNKFRVLNPFLLKMDKSGEIEWKKKYISQNIEVPNKIYRLQNEGYLMVGYSTEIQGKEYSQVHSNVFVQRCNSKGEKIWFKKIGNDNINQEGIVSRELNTSDLIIVGKGGNSTLELIKLNSNGKLVWHKKHRTDNILEEIDLIVNNNIIVKSKIKNKKEKDGNALSTYVLKLSQYGNILNENYSQEFHLARKEGKKQDDSDYGIITHSDVRVRRRPSTTALVLGVVTKNDSVKVLNRSEKKYQISNMNNYWYELKIDSSRGWVYGNFIEFEKPKG